MKKKTTWACLFVYVHVILIKKIIQCFLTVLMCCIAVYNVYEHRILCTHCIQEKHGDKFTHARTQAQASTSQIPQKTKLLLFAYFE